MKGSKRQWTTHPLPRGGTDLTAKLHQCFVDVARPEMKQTDTEKFAETVAGEAESYGVSLTANSVTQLSNIYELLQRWNTVSTWFALHAATVCTRHVLESLVLLKHLPANAKLVEVGAGAGLPIIPCLIVRPDLEAVLIEASKKKSVFLREALAHTGASARGRVIDQRFESVEVPEVGFVTCRALERFDDMLPRLLAWALPGSTLLLFGAKRLQPRIENEGYEARPELLTGSKARFLFVVQKTGEKGNG